MKISLSDAEKSIDFIWLWFEKADRGMRERLLDEQTCSVDRSRSIFFGMTEVDVGTFFRELEYLAMLDLLSATEAAIRVDFWTRVRTRRRDALSRQFRHDAKRFKPKISLDEHVLRAWTSHQPGLKSEADDFRRALKLRHWLAHGRYWTPKFGTINYSPLDAFDVCDRLLRKMHLR